MPGDYNIQIETQIVIVICISSIIGLAIWAWTVVSAANRVLTQEERDIVEVSRNGNLPEALRTSISAGSYSLDSGTYTDQIQRSRFLAGIFVFIGLAGTVLGIAISLSSIAGRSGGNSEQDLKSVMSSIQSVLHGMATATWCTFAGIAATLLVSWLNNKYLMRADAVMAKLAEVWEKYFRQTAEEKLLEREVGVLKNALTGALIDAQTANTASINLSLATFGNKLSTAQADMTSSLTAALRDVRTSVFTVTNSLSETVAELNQSLLPTAATLKKAASTAAEVANTLDAARLETATAAKLLTESLASGQRQMEIIERAVKQSADALAQGYDQLQKIAASLEATVIGLSDERQQALEALVTERAQTLTSLAGERSSTLDALAKDRAEVLGSLKSDREAMLETIVREREASVKAVSSEARLSRDAAKRAEDASIALRELLEKQHNEQRDQVRDLVTGVRASDRHQAELLARFEETLADVTAITEQTALRDAVVNVSDVLTATTTEIHAGVSALNRNGRAIDSTLSKISISADALRDGVVEWDKQARNQAAAGEKAQAQSAEAASAAADASKSASSAAADAKAAAASTAEAARTTESAATAIVLASTKTANAAESLQAIAEAEAKRTAAIAELSRLNSFENTILRTESAIYRDYLARTSTSNIKKESNMHISLDDVGSENHQ